MKLIFALNFSILILATSFSTSAQEGYGTRWNFPDSQAHIFLPEGVRKQRVRDNESQVGHWKSKDKKFEIQAYIFAVGSDEDRSKEKWKQQFLDELGLELIASETFYSVGKESWVTSARRKGGPQEPVSARQAVMVKNDFVYVVRGIAPEGDEKLQRKVGVSVRSLSPNLPGESKEAAEEKSNNGLEGSVWASQYKELSIFIPKGFHSPEQQVPNVIKQWDSLYYGASISIFKETAFPKNNLMGEDARQKVFVDEFMAGFEGEFISFESDTIDEREVWKIKSNMEQLGEQVECNSWFFRENTTLYCLFVCNVIGDEEAERVRDAVLESVELSFPVYGKEIYLPDSKSVDTDLGGKNKRNFGDGVEINWARVAGRVGGACLLFLIGLGIWSRAR